MANTKSFSCSKLRNQLTCGRCHSFYTNPKTLSCHHSLCQQCIEGYIFPTFSVACPVCHQCTGFEDHAAAAAGFKDSYHLVELKKIYEEMRKLNFAGEVRCNNCSNDNATGYCKNCNQYFCQNCIGAHNNWAAFASHTISPINDEIASHVKPILLAVYERQLEIRVRGEEVKEEIRSFLNGLISRFEDKYVGEVNEIVDRKLQMLEKQKKLILNAAQEISEFYPLEKADIHFKTNSESIMSHHVGSVVSSAGLQECKVKEITAIKHMPEEKSISFELSIELPDNENSLLVLPSSCLTLNIVPATGTMPCKVMNARVIPTDKPGVYQVICTPVIRGRHQVMVRVLGIQLNASSFLISFNPYTHQSINPVRTIYDLNTPRGVAVSDDGHIVVSEFGPNIISILSQDGKKLKSFGKGTNNITFSANQGVAITDDGYILVADYGNHNIQKISMDGQYVTSVGSYGRGTLEFRTPRGIAVSPLTKHIFIADENNGRVQVLNPDLTFSYTFGTHGKGNGEFKNSHDIAIDSKGLVYVTDWNNHRVQKFTHDGKYLSQFGSEGSGQGQLCRPGGIATDNAGLVYISEYGNHRVSVFTNEGMFVRSFGKYGAAEDQFNDPLVGMTFDKDGLLYICDNNNHRLVVY